MVKLSPDAQTLIDAARNAHDPTPEARARGDAAVRVALAMHGVTDLPPLDPAALSATAQAGSSAATPAVSGGLGLKVALGASAAAILTASLFAAYAPARSPASGGTAPALRGGASSSPPSSVSSPIAASLSIAAPRTPPVTRREPTAAPADRTGAAETERTPARRRWLARGAPRTARATPQVTVAIADEVRLISAANGHVLAGRYQEALRILDWHTQRFPRGALREERSALRVLSLCGRAADVRAQRERARFLRNSPQSVLTERVRAACAAPDQGSP
jgi:hypothetical protein